MGGPPPFPADAGERARIDHSRLRRRLMSEAWGEDLQARMRKNLGPVRSEAIGEADMSANPFEAICTGSSALYDLVPKIEHSQASAVSAMTALTDRALLWPMMARNQAITLAQRELFLRVDVVGSRERPEVVYTPAFVDLCLVDADPRRPSRPSRLRHAVTRPHPQRPSETVWTYDDWDLSGAVPARRILEADGETDMSAAYGLPPGGLVGEAYPALRSDGTPLIPYSTYHAATTGYLLDPYYRRPLVEGTLNVAVLWTFFHHCIRAASWPQRYLIGGAVASEATEGNVRRVVADPATILEILSDPNFEGQVSAGQWGSASDPKAVAEAIGMYEARFTGYVGMDPSDLQRTSGDPRSGYALAISQEARIRAQRRYAPIFAPSDAETIAITAALVNRHVGGAALPEEGWVVEHTSLPPSIEERDARRAEAIELRRERLISRVEARMRILGEDRTTAIAALAEIDAEEASGPPHADVPSMTGGADGQHDPGGQSP